MFDRSLQGHQYLSLQLKQVKFTSNTNVMLKKINRKKVQKVSFNVSTLCVDNQLKTFRKRLTRVTNCTLGSSGLYKFSF